MTTSLIGRESEVAEIEAAVKAHRLVTLTGVGGVGKTRLALEVAARVDRRVSRRRLGFRAGRGHRSGGGARCGRGGAGHHPTTGQDRESSRVAAALEGRVRLLVIDNCEHVLDAAADLIEAILAALGDRDDSGHQPRRTRSPPTNSYGAVPSLDVDCGNRLGRGEPCSSSARKASRRTSR